MVDLPAPVGPTIANDLPFDNLKDKFLIIDLKDSLNTKNLSPYMATQRS